MRWWDRGWCEEGGGSMPNKLIFRNFIHKRISPYAFHPTHMCQLTGLRVWQSFDNWTIYCLSPIFGFRCRCRCVHKSCCCRRATTTRRKRTHTSNFGDTINETIPKISAQCSNHHKFISDDFDTSSLHTRPSPWWFTAEIFTFRNSLGFRRRAEHREEFQRGSSRRWYGFVWHAKCFIIVCADQTASM